MAAAASVALASLLALLATNETSQVDCLCSRIFNETGSCPGWRDDASNFTKRETWDLLCTFYYNDLLIERCKTLEGAATVVAAIARLVPWDWRAGLPPTAGWDRECGAALAELDQVTEGEETSLDSMELYCHLADGLTEHYSAQGLNDTKWTAEALAADHETLSQLLHGARSIVTALGMVKKCEIFSTGIFGCRQDDLEENNTSAYRQAELAFTLKHQSTCWRRAARLHPPFATHLSQLFIPLAYQHVGNHTNGQDLHGWIKNMERVRDMLDTKLQGLIHDGQFVSEQLENYKIEEDENPEKVKLRRPLLSDRLLKYQDRLLSLGEDFGALCKQQLPHASQVFGLADALYSLYRKYFTPGLRIRDNFTADEEWHLEDQSNETVLVDTGCLQLLADTMDRPRCPLEELPLEAIKCRQQLWRDLVERPPRPPVTSYLAYSERAEVSLCLLAWMAANSRGVCQDVPFSIMQSVHDALCYFNSPGNQTCLQSSTTDAICSVSRALLLLKCRDFSSVKTPDLCSANFRNGEYEIRNSSNAQVYGQPTQTTLSYKESLNRATLKYRYFKVESLKPLEYSFIAVNILFRLLLASVYMWLPHLGNLPGKILLSFQLTGLAQVLCSEVVYRMVGFPDVSTAALVDSCLTLLGCLWLNTFSYQMFVCVRDLRLPDHLTPAEASMVFRRQLWWALIPWATVSTACAALEKSSKHYLMASRITLIVAISSSVALNLILLGLVGYTYLRNKKSMERLSITSDNKGYSKKKLIFLSVNTIILSGICVIIRIGFHQATGIAQYVYYVHIATMLQGPVLFVFLACNGTTLPVLRNRVLALWRPGVYRTELELCSAAERNLARRRGEPPPDAETSL